MDRCSPRTVKSVFQHLQTALGNADDFAFHFPVLLTYRRQEFKKTEDLERDPAEHAQTSIFYFDPMRSN